MSAVSLYSVVLVFVPASLYISCIHPFIYSSIHLSKVREKPNYMRLNRTSVQQGKKCLFWNKACNNGDLQQREQNSLCRELRRNLLLLTLWSVHSEWSADVQFVVALLPTPSDNLLFNLYLHSYNELCLTTTLIPSLFKYLFAVMR